MSGGSLDYLCYTLAHRSWPRSRHIIYRWIIYCFLTVWCDVLHDLEWVASGDYSRDDLNDIYGKIEDKLDEVRNKQPNEDLLNKLCFWEDENEYEDNTLDRSNLQKAKLLFQSYEHDRVAKYYKRWVKLLLATMQAIHDDDDDDDDDTEELNSQLVELLQEF